MSLVLKHIYSALDEGLESLVADAIEAEGYAIVTNLVPPKVCRALINEVDRIEASESIEYGKNDFEGFHTRRIFNLILRAPLFRELVIDETLLRLTEAILGDGFLLSGTTSMHISPNETPQLLHADDGMISLPRPHPATMMTTLFALSDFEALNGATQFVPGSHRHPNMPRPGENYETASAAMAAGSVLFLHGSIWHGGGANSTIDYERYGLSIQFVAGWCRQQQNLMLGTPAELVASYPRRLQELIGYTVYRNVMGHVDRKHPLTLLGVEEGIEMVWDKMNRE